MNAYGVIYIATNLTTGEVYVGQTKQRPDVRFYAHKIAAKNPKTVFHNAVAEYGWDNFVFSVVASCFTREGLNATEKLLIAQYKPQYNSTRGGAGRPRSVSDSERRRLSEQAKKRWADPEWRKRTMETITKNASLGVYTESGRRGGLTGAGARGRWENHVPKPQSRKDRAASIAASWLDPCVRDRRLAGLRAANRKEEVRLCRSAAGRRRVMAADAVARTARKKWKPVYCPELQITFLSRSAASAYIGVGKAAVSEALRHARKVAGKYTLREVSHQL